MLRTCSLPDLSCLFSRRPGAMATGGGDNLELEDLEDLEDDEQSEAEE